MASQSVTTPTFFEKSQRIPPDRIFEITKLYQQNSSPNKVNLGQGAYRNEVGEPWVLPSVQAARARLLSEGLNHEYLPIMGHAGFREEAARLVLGDDLYNAQKSEGLSGTGSLRLAARLFARSSGAPASGGPPKILIPRPAYANHGPVLSQAGLECEFFDYFDSARSAVDVPSYKRALEAAAPGTAVLLHACAHNPTGCDPSREEWVALGEIIKERRLFPVFDAAYLGFNSGSVDEDAFAIRYFVRELGLEAAVCVSFAKNMGLYGERTGAVIVRASSAETAADCESMLEQLQRQEVSNPPAFGAKIAHLVLSDGELRGQWYQDLVTMSDRIREMRRQLYEGLVKEKAPGQWTHITSQSGMFGFLGLSPQIVTGLRESYHIFMADNSRISIAGLNERNIDYVAASIASCVRKEAEVSSK
ncbi:hypothetical protein N3K66_008156 [Trichothecium roseum]|uniref:Uncharacterized protein n=1 Tax=Trichothecium roseum TaxID=47278 RepID=A0ACC0UUF3_9HYPO|nr:hypothetical protein N3K66_008156 [Trichothecium roseum]